MKISPIDIAALNGDEPEFCGDRWIASGSPFRPMTPEERARIDFEESANFDPVPEK